MLQITVENLLEVANNWIRVSAENARSTTLRVCVQNASEAQGNPGGKEEERVYIKMESRWGGLGTPTNSKR